MRDEVFLKSEKYLTDLGITSVKIAKMDLDGLSHSYSYLVKAIKRDSHHLELIKYEFTLLRMVEYRINNYNKVSQSSSSSSSSSSLPAAPALHTFKSAQDYLNALDEVAIYKRLADLYYEQAINKQEKGDSIGFINDISQSISLWAQLLKNEAVSKDKRLQQDILSDCNYAEKVLKGNIKTLKINAELTKTKINVQMISADLTKAKMKLAPAYLSQAEESIRCHKDHTLAISDSTKAIGLFEELMSINKIDGDQIKKDLALSYYYRGVANKRVGDKDTSLADFEKAKSLDPTCTPENREKIKSSALKQEFSTPPFSARDAGILPPISQSKVSLHSSASLPREGYKRKLDFAEPLSEIVDKRCKAVNSKAQHESADFQLGE